MYIIDTKTPITTKLIGDIIGNFRTTKLPTLNRWYKYYLGQHDILQKTVNVDWHKNNKITANFCSYVVDSYVGFIAGNNITYSSQDDITAITDVLAYNDTPTEDNQLLKNALIYGVGYELQYIDEEGHQRYTILDSKECIPIWYNTLGNDLAGVIRFYAEDNVSTNPNYFVELYLSDFIFVYKTDMSFTSFQLVDERAHYYGQVPINVFMLNENETNIFDGVMTLNDAYNTLLSSEVDDYESWCDTYMVLAGMEADEETIKSMTENRALILPEGGSAGFLEKDASAQKITEILENIEQKIHKISNVPDFSSDAFATSSGIAMKMKMLGFTNTAGTIEKTMRKVLQRRIELICTILNLSTGEVLWRDISINFNERMPENIDDIATKVNSFRGLVSDKTLLGQIPFVDDVDEEIEAMREQKENDAQLYNFDLNNEG